MVQDTWMRRRAAQRERIENAQASLVSVATHLSIDRPRAAKVEREHYIGMWLPEPVLSDASPSPEQMLEQVENVSIAFLTLLERLAPGGARGLPDARGVRRQLQGHRPHARQERGRLPPARAPRQDPAPREAPALPRLARDATCGCSGSSPRPPSAATSRPCARCWPRTPSSSATAAAAARCRAEAPLRGAERIAQLLLRREPALRPAHAHADRADQRRMGLMLPRRRARVGARLRDRRHEDPRASRRSAIPRSWPRWRPCCNARSRFRCVRAAGLRCRRRARARRRFAAGAAHNKA